MNGHLVLEFYYLYSKHDVACLNVKLVLRNGCFLPVCGQITYTYILTYVCRFLGQTAVIFTRTARQDQLIVAQNSIRGQTAGKSCFCPK